MGKIAQRLIVAVILIALTGFAFSQGLNTGGVMSRGYEVGATQSYIWATAWQTYRMLFLGGGGIALLVAIGLFLIWIVQRKAAWWAGMSLFLAGVAAFSLGFGVTQTFAGTHDLDSIRYQEQLYRLSVWRGSGPGGWQIWRCVDSDDACTVVEVVAATFKVDGLRQEQPARLEIDPATTQLVLIVETVNGSAQIPITE